MKAKQENIVKEREQKLAQKQAEKDREKQRALEAKQAEKDRQKRQVCMFLFCLLLVGVLKFWNQKVLSTAFNILDSSSVI